MLRGTCESESGLDRKGDRQREGERGRRKRDKEWEREMSSQTKATKR